MILPYLSLIGSGVATSIGVGKIAGNKSKKFNYGASFGVAASSLLSSSLCNAILDESYNNLMEREKAQTTNAYVQQLSDEELEVALIKFNLLESEDNTNVKVL